MVTGFYAALAGAASIFIGILTALLVTKLSDIQTDRTQLRLRAEEINARLQSLKTGAEELEDQIDDVQWAMESQDHEQEAQERVSEFIEEAVGDSFDPDPDTVDLEDVVEALAEFEDVPKKEILGDEFVLDEIEERLDYIRYHLVPQPAIKHVEADSEQAAAQRQIDFQRRIHLREQYNNFQNRWHQTKTEVQALKNERSKIDPKYDALDTTRLTHLLKVIGLAIVLSVGIPLLFYLLRVVEVSFVDFPSWVEPTVVSVSWIVGLGLVLYEIHREIVEEEDQIEEDLPEMPDIDIGESPT